MRTLICLFFISISCTPENKYDDTRLINFLNNKLTYSSDTRENLIILVLQNEECICTEENMNFAVNVFNSPKYQTYKKLLVLKSNRHKILKNKKLDQKAVQVFINDNQVLENYGLYFATDRVFRYSDGRLVTHDLHTESLSELKNEFL